MKKLLKLTLILALFGQACQPSKEKSKTLTSELDSIFAASPDFSGVVLIADKGQPVYHKAFRYTNFETKSPIDTASIFELASVSKTFTGVMIGSLQEQGKLMYDEPIEKYIPGLPYPAITVRHLLNHTSGLPDYQKIMDEHWDKSKPAGNADIIEYLKRYHPPKLSEPGEQYTYSNTGYVLLGSIVEKVSGRDFVELCRERIFIPLKMTSTDIRSIAEKAVLKNLALGHIYVPEKKRYVLADSFPSSNYVFWLGARKGPGRISSTSTDLLKWDRALYTEGLVKKETLVEAFTPSKLKDDSLSNYGLGWELRTHPLLGKVVWHSGDNPGYKTALVRYIEVDKTVIVLSNTGPEKFFDRLAAVDRLLGIYK